MTQKIEQEFLINASQALNILGQLDRGFESFENRLKSVAQTISLFNSGGDAKAFSDLNKEAQKAATALANVEKSMGNLAKRTKDVSTLEQRFGKMGLAVEQLGNLTNNAGISFETLSRIIQAQVVVRTLNAIRDAAFEAAESAGELQKQIALIQTIATSAEGGESRLGVDTERIGAAVRTISDNLNIPQLEVAQGLYNAISNQVGNFAESLQFANEAGRFAKATNSTLAESVDTLSAVLRSYNLGVDQTTRVSNVLFATIDKGRVTADELANTLGRVLPAANELGVPLEEVAAAVANISDKGLSTDETLTQVRATFTGLLKPSDALKAAYDKLGIASGEVGIRTFGLGGFLDKLRTSAGGTSAELAALFPNVRNLGGVLAITGNNARNYQETLDDIVNSSDLAKDAFDIATDTDFEKITSSLNRLKNVAIELGDEFLGSVSDFVDLAGGEEAIAEAGEFALRTLTRLIPIAATLGAGLLATSNAARVLALALSANPILLTVAAMSALTIGTIEYLNAIQSAEFAKIEEHFTNLEQFDAKQAEVSLRALGIAAETNFKQFEQAVRGGLIASQDSVAAYRAMLPVIQETDAKLTASTKNSLDDVIKAREGYVRELVKAAAEADKIADASVARVQDLQSGQQTRIFDRSIKGLGDAQQILKLTERSQQLANSAASELIAAGRTGDERGIQKALDAFNESDRLATTAQDIAERTGNRALEAQAVARVAATVNTQVAAEKQLQAIQKQRQVDLERERERQAQIADELKRQAKIVVDNAGLFDKDGRQFNESELASRGRASAAALNNLLEAQFSKGDFDLASVLGVADFARNFGQELAATTSQVQLNLNLGSQQISSQLSDALAGFNAEPLTIAVKEALNIAVNEAFTPANMEAALDTLEAEFKNRQQALTTIAAGTLEAGSARQRAQTGVGILAELGADNRESPSFLLNESFRELTLAVEQGRIEIQRLLDEGASVSELEQGFKGVAARVNELAEAQRAQGDNTADKFQRDIKALNELRDQLTQYRDGLLKIQEGEKTLGANIDSDKLQKVFDLQTSTSNTAQNLGLAATNASSLADSIARIDTSRLNFGGFNRGINAAFGAMPAYFNSGGLNRGVDTQPAMLSRGESVINARSTAKFFSQIQAINAGQTPVFRAQNGGVTNVGDINVTIQGQSSSSATGRAIASELRREIRRGTSRL